MPKILTQKLTELGCLECLGKNVFELAVNFILIHGNTLVQAWIHSILKLGRGSSTSKKPFDSLLLPSPELMVKAYSLVPPAIQGKITAATTLTLLANPVKSVSRQTNLQNFTFY